MRHLLAGVTAVIVLAVAAPVLAQDAAPQATTFSVTPTVVKRLKKVTLTGTGWGANLGTTCTPVTVTATDPAGGGPARLFSRIAVEPPAYAIRRVVIVRLPVGNYRLSASQSCTKELGGGAATSIAKLTVT
jgi:hypothetical protein